VLGLLSLPFGILSPFAIWTGGRSLFRIRTSRGEVRGARSAATGLIAGLLALITSIIGTAYWLASS
jgi:hypothetical protein